MQKSLEILVAEHDRDVAEGLSDILDMAGHKVHRAFNAETAEELLRLYDFHIAFVNIKKPGLSNMECFADLRKIEPDARLIMMSAHTIDQLIAQITDGGAVKVRRPPLTTDSVLEVLEEIGATGTLLIEDAPADFGTTLQSALAARNTNLGIAHDGAEALAWAAEGNCDVLLLDLRLTVIRSLEVLLEVRRQGHSRPTIIFQSYADDGPASNSVSGTDIFFKPFDPAQMVELLENIADMEDGVPASQAPAAEATPAPATPVPAAAEAPDTGHQAAESAAQGGVSIAVSESDAVLTRQDVEAPQTPPFDLDVPLAGSPPESALGPVEDPVSETSSPVFEAPDPGIMPTDAIAPVAQESDSDASAVPAETDTGSAPPFADEAPPFADEAPSFADDLPAQGFAQGSRADAEPEPPRAAEPDAPEIKEPVPEQDKAEAFVVPSPLLDAPIQAEDPAADSQETETTSIWAEDPAAGTRETGTASIWDEDPVAAPRETEATSIWAEEPAAVPQATEAPSIRAEESPSEARLPAGVGMSADQLERAVNEPGIERTDSNDGAPAGRHAAPESGSQESRVLVIDDDRDMAEGLAEILEDCGLNVKVAHTSESAVATLDDFDAQIALVDIQLGKNSGLDLIADLKQKRPNLIAVMVTAQTDQQSAIIALRNGAFDYLNKPLHPQELLAAMDRCFDELAKRATGASARQAQKAAGDDLEEASSEYMAKLSHKLRTPLNAVVGFSEILSEELLGPLGSTQYLGYAHDIKEASESLIDVIDHFEDVDASESGKVEINEEEVDFTQIIFHCLKMIQPAVDAGKLTVEIELAEIPVFMVGDNHKLTQVMLSLLTNAVKFTPSQGRICFNQRRDEAGGIVVDIIDTGVGIAEEVITEALSSVVEGDGALDPDYQGGGLGLPLATSMVELHGGRLTLDSDVGVGTTATLTLPPERNIAPKRTVAV